MWSGLTLQIRHYDGSWAADFDSMRGMFAAGSIAFTVWLSSCMGAPDEESAPFHLAGRSLMYIPWLIKEIVLCNLHVAEVILRRDLPIRPRLIRVRSGQQTDLGQVIYANSITITPGTVSLDVRNNYILVHALTTGAAFCVLCGVGMLRMPDSYSRCHAAGLGDTMGALLITLGLIRWLIVAKLLVILAFLWVTGPIATHALVKAAYAKGVRVDGEVSDAST